MFNISSQLLFTPYSGIRYLSIMDSKFIPGYFSGKLSFYGGNPEYIVSVALWDEKKNLKEEDVEIVRGTLTTSEKVDDMIREKRDAIFNICKNYHDHSFILDVERLKVIEPEDFTQSMPVRGLNTIFRFENVSDKCSFCLVNNKKDKSTIEDRDLYTWLISYIYASRVCLAPVQELYETGTIQFFQALTNLAASRGNKKKLYATSNPIILQAPIANSGEYDIELSGNLDRFNALLNKASGKYKRS